MTTKAHHKSDPLGAVVAYAITHARAVLVVSVLIMGALLWLARGLTLDALPDVTPNQVQVLTRAPGLSPDEVERLVTTPIENALGGAAGVDTHRSVSRTGLSAVTVVFDDATDPWRARQIVAERTSTVVLPDFIDQPELGPLTGGLGEIVQMTLRSDTLSPADLYDVARLRLAPVLRSVKGVVEVNAWGGARRTFEIAATPSGLATHRVTLAALKDSLTSAQGAASGKALDAGSGEVLLRANARPSRAEDLCDAGIVRAAGSAAAVEETGRIRICDVAVAREGQVSRIGAATADGVGEVVYVMAQMLRDENALEVTGRVEEALPRIRALLPSNVTLDVHYDRKNLVMATLRTVASSLTEGGVLVLLVLFVLLGSVRAGLVVALTIPTSMIAAAAAMAITNTPGNLMSLGAIDFGIIVDGSVVMVERIFHVLGTRRQSPHAASHGAFDDAIAHLADATRGVARPVVFAVLVIIAVYAPVLLLEGVDGKMFRPMALTMVFALASSLALSLLTVPAMASLALNANNVPHTVPRVVQWAERLHDAILTFCSTRRIGVFVAAMALLALGALTFATTESAFVPTLDEGDLVVMTTRSADIGEERAVSAALALEDVIRQTPEVRTVTSRIGSPAVATDVMGLEQADIFVALKPEREWHRGLTKDELVKDIDARIKAHDPVVDVAFTQPIQMRFNELSGGDVNDVAVIVSGTDLEIMMTHASALATWLGEVSGAEDVRVMSPPDIPLVEVRPRALDLRRLGLTASDILDAVATLKLGLTVGSTFKNGVEVPIVLRYDAPVDIFTLKQMPLVLDNGTQVPLSSVADVVLGKTPSVVIHGLSKRRIVVGFNVRGRDLGGVARDVDTVIAQHPAPDGVHIAVGGQVEGMQRANRRLALVIPLALASVFFLLWWTFRRLRTVWIVLLNVPFAITGGVFALFVRGLPLSMSAAIGFIALVGVAVLNGVVLMDDVQKREHGGASPHDAVMHGARSRLRPVLMTAAVAMLGFVPMMVASGVGAEVQRPLATVVVGGLFTSTLLTLVLLPTLYPWFAKRSPVVTSPSA